MRKIFKTVKLSVLLFTALAFFSCFDSGGRSGGKPADNPGTLLVKNIPDRVSVASGAGSAFLLFDGDTTTSLQGENEISVTVKYNGTKRIGRIKVFDTGKGSLSVYDKSNRIVSDFSVTTGNSGKWISRELPECISADTLTFR
nr:hypothetical protein [Spirochaetota bacterium]